MSSSTPVPVLCTLPNPNTTSLKESNVHFLPFSIAYSGPARVDTFFHPQLQQDYYEKLSSDLTLLPKPQPFQQHPTYTADFRGHKILGHKHLLPENTIGVVLQSSTNPLQASSTTLAPHLSSTNSQSNTQNTQQNDLSSQTNNLPSTVLPTTTTLRKRTTRNTRSKQDAMFDDLDEDGNHNQSQQISQQPSFQMPPFSSTSSQQPLHSSQSINSGSASSFSSTMSEKNDKGTNKSGEKQAQVTAIFKEVFLWDPEVISDTSLFDYRRQPIDELIPLANSLHCDTDDE